MSKRILPAGLKEYEVEVVFWVQAENPWDAKCFLTELLQEALKKHHAELFKPPVDREFYMDPDKIVIHEEEDDELTEEEKGLLKLMENPSLCGSEIADI